MDSLLYLLISLVVISLAFAGANYLAWRLFDKPRHALVWAVTYLLVALQYSLNLGRDLLPSEAFFWVSANLVSHVLVICAVWGHRLRLELVTPLRTLVLWVVALTGATLMVVVIKPNDALRIAISPGFAFLGMAYIAYLLLATPREPRLPQRLAASVHFLFGLSQGGAAAVALYIAVTGARDLLQLYHLVNFALMPAFFVAMGIAVLLLLATDLSRKLELLATTDQLTAVANRRGFLQAAEALLAMSRRAEKPLSMVLCDIDYFKRINDRFGHTGGDRALQRFAGLLRDSVRTEDVVGRIGGEEFAIALAGMDSREAERVTARLRESLHAKVQASGYDIELTASFGIAQLGQDDDIQALLQRADDALYVAKNSGRDTVHIAAALSPAVS